MASEIYRTVGILTNMGTSDVGGYKKRDGTVVRPHIRSSKQGASPDESASPNAAKAAAATAAHMELLRTDGDVGAKIVTEYHAAPAGSAWRHAAKADNEPSHYGEFGGEQRWLCACADGSACDAPDDQLAICARRKRETEQAWREASEAFDTLDSSDDAAHAAAVAAEERTWAAYRDAFYDDPRAEAPS